MTSSTKLQVPAHRRGHIAAEYQSPGPIYKLNNLCGSMQHESSSRYNKNPAFSFGSRTKSAQKSDSPGPCYYPNANLNYRGKSGAPSYSLHFRTKSIEKFKAPGPGTYSPDSVDKHSSAKFSFGHKLNSKRIADTPAPNRYTLPSVFGKTVQSQLPQAPAALMGMRPQTISHKRTNPGPGTYNIVDMNNYSKKMPSFSMRGARTDIICPKGTASTPGPGAYLSLKIHEGSQKSSAKFSFGVKHSPYITPAIFSTE